MRYSASIDYKNFSIKSINKYFKNVDFIHIDITDDTIAKKHINLFKDLKKFIPLDIHINNPSWKIILNQLFFLDKNDCISIQIDHLNEEVLLNNSNLFKNQNSLIGFACSVEFDFMKFDFYKFKNYLNFIHLSSSVASVTGAPFNFSTFRIINYIKKNYDYDVHVDGGVSDRVISILSFLKVDQIIMGSFFNNFNDLKNAINLLNYNLGKLNNLDFKQEFIPVFKVEPDDDILHVLSQIQSSGYGLVKVVNNKMLRGIITDGDIRKYFLKNKFFNVSKTKAKDLMNPSPMIFNYNELDELVSLFFLDNRFNNFLIFYKDDIFILPAGSVLRKLV